MIKLITAAVSCNNAEMVDGVIYGMPTEKALLSCAHQLGYIHLRSAYTRLQEWPFSSETKLMMVKCTDEHGGIIYFIKGALERVLEKCRMFYYYGVHSSLDESAQRRIVRDGARLGNSGLRTLAFAYSMDGNSFTFLGLMGIVDPPRQGVSDAIEMLSVCGVKVKMITGDSPETATSIAQRLGIYEQGDISLSGSEIDKMDTRSLEDIIDRVSVFYRTSPKHKTVIVNCLQRRGLIAGMTGDGVNDAIALKSANIGIAMGKTGTDVSKEAADVILVNDQFTSLIAAIEEGRGIFHNIRNFVRFQLSTSIAALTLIAMSTLAGLPNPLNPMQILWINILMDGPPAQSLGVEPVDHDVIRLPPRKAKENIVNHTLIFNVVISAAVIVCGTLYIFWKEMSDNQITPRDTTMTFTCFVFFDMFNAMACRSQTKSIFDIGLFSNRAFLLSVGGSLLGQFLVIYFPPLQAIFQTEALFISDLILLLCLTSSVFAVSEVRKFCLRRGISPWNYYLSRNKSPHHVSDWSNVV